MLFRIGQLSVDALRRSFKLASSAIKHQLLQCLPLGPDTPPPLQPNTAPLLAPITPGVPGPTAPAQTLAQSPYLVQNLCPVTLLFGQVGTDEAVSLPAHGEVGYRWHTPPHLTPTAVRAIHLAIAPPGHAEDYTSGSAPADKAAVSHPSLQQPTTGALLSPHSPSNVPAETPPGHSTTRSGLLCPSLREQGAAVPKQQLRSTPAWAPALDCTASTGCQQQLLMPSGAHCQVAISVQKIGPQWHICLQPSYVVCSKLANLAHLHYTGQLAGLETGPTQDSTSLMVLPDSQVSAHMLCLVAGHIERPLKGQA